MDPKRQKKISGLIRERFDRVAHDYDQFEAASRFFDRLTGELAAMGPELAHRRVLDIGCGTGISTRFLEREVGETGFVVGVDLSLGMLKRARETMGTSALLVAGDGCGVGALFAPAFDAVFFNASIFMLPDAHRALEGARSVLSKGGWVLASALASVIIEPLNITVADYLARMGMETGKHTLSPWERVEASFKTLLDKVAIRTIAIELDKSDFDGFYGLEPMSAGLMPRVAKSEREQALIELSSRVYGEGHKIVQNWHLATGAKSV